MRISRQPGDLPVGARVVRTYKGRTHVVEVVKAAGRPSSAKRPDWGRYLYNPRDPADPRSGHRYKSLSAVAYAITGLRYQSGARFFGFRSYPRRKGDGGRS